MLQRSAQLSSVRDTYLSSLLPGETSRVYKNLGMLHHFNGSNMPEVKARVLAAKRGYYSMGAFWSILAGQATPMLGHFFVRWFVMLWCPGWKFASVNG